jgi:hypothetical protein
MGAFFTNLQVRNAATKAVRAALPKLSKSRAYVSPVGQGWITVYIESTEDQNQDTLSDIAGKLSEALKTDVLAFMVHDSSVAFYWLYRDGALADEFNSAPDYFGESVDEETKARLGGKTDSLLPLCPPGAAREQLDAILHPPDGHPVFAEEIVTDLAKLLGIDEARATLGFKHFSDEGEDTLPDAADFAPVGKGVERKPATNSSPSKPGGDSRQNANSDADAATLDMYPLAVQMMTKTWTGEHEKQIEEFSKILGGKTDGMLKQFQTAQDKVARQFYKSSRLKGLPTFEELKAARDQGPAALAELVSKKSPGQLAQIGVAAANDKLESFLAELLKNGLDPNAPDFHGRTTLETAKQNGINLANDLSDGRVCGN